MSARGLWVLWGVLSLAACGDGPPPESTLTGYRVLGLVADQPEIAPDGRVSVQAVDHDTEGRPATYAWSLCFYSLGSRVRFACADPALEQTLEATGPVVALDFGPAGLDFERRFEAASPLVGLDGETLTLEEGVDVVVALTAAVAGDRTVRIYKRIRVRRGGVPNRNPTIATFEVPTTVAAGALLDLAITLGEATPETYEESGTGRTYTERLTVNFYADGGNLADRGLFEETDLETTWRAPAEPGPVTLFVAVRDGRGGLAVEKRVVTVTP